jgi:acetyl-CoA synthetase
MAPTTTPTDPAWQDARDRLAGLPDGEGVNIAYEAVDRHLDEGHGSDVAFRFLAKTDQPDAAGETYTYQRLSLESNRFAHALRSLDVWPGETVFVLAGRVPRLYVAVLGALKGQHLVCPLFSAFGPEPIKQRMCLGDATVLVTTSALYRRKVAPMRAELPARHYVLLDVDDQADAPEGTLAYGSLVDAQPTHFRIAPTDPESPAVLHFTSGTTGTPKGALHVHDAVAMHRATTEAVFGLRRGDTYWCTADPGWVTGTSYGIIGPLTVGARRSWSTRRSSTPHVGTRSSTRSRSTCGTRHRPRSACSCTPAPKRSATATSRGWRGRSASESRSAPRRCGGGSTRSASRSATRGGRPRPGR